MTIEKKHIYTFKYPALWGWLSLAAPKDMLAIYPLVLLFYTKSRELTKIPVLTQSEIENTSIGFHKENSIAQAEEWALIAADRMAALSEWCFLHSESWRVGVDHLNNKPDLSDTKGTHLL